MSEELHNNTEISRKLFRWAIGYLHHHIPCEDDLIPYGFSRVVNYSFACELIIKSHLARENNPTSGHLLKNLFENLDQHIQNSVSTRVSSRFSGKIYNTDNFVFNDILDEQTNVFTEWRYPYDRNYSTPLENTRGHHGFLLVLALELINSYQTKYCERPDYNGKCPVPEITDVDTFYTLH